MSKTLVFIIAVALFGLLLFAGLLYYTLRTKVTEVSNKRPYSEYVGKKVYSKRNAIIALSREADIYINPYVLTENEDELMLETDPRYMLPHGTELNIISAKIFKNGTSGFEHAYVLGNVFIKELNQKVSFEYKLGEGHTSIYNEYEDYWTFPTAIWQEVRLLKRNISSDNVGSSYSMRVNILCQRILWSRSASLLIESQIKSGLPKIWFSGTKPQ